MLKGKQLTNIFNIQSSHNFLFTLSKWILQQYQDPFYLSNITLLLPSRRACREIKRHFLINAKNEAIILPRILAIGDVDYDQFYSLDDVFIKNNKIDYQLRLIEEIRDWNFKTGLFGKKISTASLAEIADNLQMFLDQVEKEGLNLEKLFEIDDSNLASHKQQILQFLQYFGGVWQNILAKDGLLSAAKIRNLTIKNYKDNLEKNGSKYPIIVAGSTGSVTQTAELLKTISSLENGTLVLFGLDKNLDEKVWQQIDENHPQFMLKKLLDKIGIQKKDVIEIKDAKKDGDFVEKLCSLAMLPAQFSDEWKVSEKHENIIRASQDKKYLKDNNLENNRLGICLLEAENEFDEAKIISLLFRKTLAKKEKTAALISNDKNFIQLVKANLLAWQIEIDDSASSNLAECELVNYLFLISQFAYNANDKFSVVDLLAILKHHLTVLDKEHLSVLEKNIFRNIVKFNGFEDLLFKLQINNNLFGFVQKTADIFQPLINEFKKDQIDFIKILKLHFDCFINMAKTTTDTDGIEEFLEFYQELLATKNSFTLEPQSYNQILRHFLKNYQFRKSGQFHPRLHILSTIEARLMNYDLVIVAGLCEGEFPSKVSDDWLGNKIRTEFGLESSAKQNGIAAYDFCNYLGNKEVILTYPTNKNNAPTIKSRFLLKLETVLEINGWQSWLKDSEQYLQLLNLDFYKQSNIQRSNPKPKHKLERFSATDISKWLKNPYYIYAKRILQLKSLKEIEQEASFAEFGNFIHKVLEEFIKNYPNINLQNYGRQIFSEYFPDQFSHLLWWSRFENIANWFEKQEIELRTKLKESFVEVEAQAIINDVILTTKVDRVNFYLDGSFEIIDYKTGTLPTTKDVKSGLEPQLAVEAIILSNGEIKNYSQLKINQIANLQYQNLKGKNQNEVKDYPPENLVKAASEGITKLIDIFNKQNFGYICCPNIDLYKEDDYWHLARIGEL
jgi:ATP-dependent helicase/nuclease subunit B